MKKDVLSSLSSSRRRAVLNLFRRPFSFTLILMASALTLALGGGWLPTSRSASGGDQTTSVNQQGLSSDVMQQLQALEDEKASRTPAQQKIDSQLIYAMKMGRSEPIALGVSTLQVDVDANSQGRVVVDISGNVDDKLLQSLTNNGAAVLVSTPEYHSVRVEVALNHLETIAALEGVTFIQPKMEYLLTRSTQTAAWWTRYGRTAVSTLAPNVLETN